MFLFLGDLSGLKDQVTIFALMVLYLGMKEFARIFARLLIPTLRFYRIEKIVMLHEQRIKDVPLGKEIFDALYIKKIKETLINQNRYLFFIIMIILFW